MTTSGCESLLSQIGSTNFLSQDYDCRPRHFEGAQGRFAAMADASRLRGFLLSGAPWRLRRPPEIYLDAMRVPMEDVTQAYTDMDGNACVAPRTSRISRLLDAGATAAVYGMAPFNPALAECAGAISDLFKSEVEAHLFLSWQSHQGLAPHYDCTDVFVIQISGEKLWTVSSQRADRPVAGAGEAEPFDADAGKQTYTLRSGDLLYIPRGMFHWAVAQSPQSLHASFVSRTPTKLEFLWILLSEAANDGRMREYYPTLNAARSGIGAGEAIDEILADLGDIARSETASEMFDELVRVRASAGHPR